MLPFAIDALAKEDRILQKILSTYLPCTPAFRLSQEMMAVVNKIGAKCSGGDRPRLRRERSAARVSLRRSPNGAVAKPIARSAVPCCRFRRSPTSKKHCVCGSELNPQKQSLSPRARTAEKLFISSFSFQE